MLGHFQRFCVGLFLGVLIVSAFGVSLCAQVEKKKPVKEESDDRKMAHSTLIMPSPGTELLRLRLPRYEKNLLVAYITADSATVIDEENILGKKVNVELINTDGTKTYAYVGDAFYNTVEGRLLSKSTFILIDPRFNAEGTKLSLDVPTHTGFIYGPVKTTLFTNTTKSL